MHSVLEPILPTFYAVKYGPKFEVKSNPIKSACSNLKTTVVKFAFLAQVQCFYE